MAANLDHNIKRLFVTLHYCIASESHSLMMNWWWWFFTPSPLLSFPFLKWRHQKLTVQNAYTIVYNFSTGCSNQCRMNKRCYIKNPFLLIPNNKWGPICVCTCICQESTAATVYLLTRMMYSVPVRSFKLAAENRASKSKRHHLFS